MRKQMRKIIVGTLVLLSAIVLVSCGGNNKEFTVSFDADNGSAIAVVKVLAGESVEKPPQDPIKEGFIFEFWSLDNKEFDFTTKINSDITLLAFYKEKGTEPEGSYTVSFDTRGGSHVANQIVKAGEKVTLPAEPVKDNFSFAGWWFEGKKFDFETRVNGNLNLVAKFDYLGIPDSEAYKGRTFNPDFDQLINNFKSNKIETEIFENAIINKEQPYYEIGYSGEIGNNPDGALWKQAGSTNNESAAFEYLVIRLRGSHGASIEDLSIAFRLDDSHELLVIPFNETLDPDLDRNERELDNEWYNYVISVADTLDGMAYKGKPGFSDVEAGGTFVGFHLMNTSGVGSGIIDFKDAYLSKLPNPSYPYEGSDYSQNRDYWFGSIGKHVESYVTILEDGYYGEKIDSDALNTHLVLRMRQDSTGIIDYSKISLAAILANGNLGEEVSFSNLELPLIGSGWLNLTIPFEDFYDGEEQVVGYQVINNGQVDIAISESFFSYLGDYLDVDYPLLDLENILMYDDFNRATIGTTSVHSTDNEIALANDFSYLISYSGLQQSTISDGKIRFDSTGGEYVDYVVHSEKKGNYNEYRYLIFKYKLDNGATLDNLRIRQSTTGDLQLKDTVNANDFVAGLGLSSIPADQENYPYQDGEYSLLIIDLFLTPGFTTDFGGFTLYYTGSGLIIDSLFFANNMYDLDTDSQFVINSFENLDLGSADSKISDNQYWANTYDTNTMIITDGEDNQALQLDGSEGSSQYHTGTKGQGRYLSFDLRIDQIGKLLSFRVGPTDKAKWAKDGDLILANGLPMIVNTDGQWHNYIIDWVASGFELTDTIVFLADNGEVYSLDNLTWYSEKPYFDGKLLWGDFEWANNTELLFGDNQYWADNYGSNATFVEVDGNMKLKLDSSDEYAQYHTGVKAQADFITLKITVIEPGGFGLNLGGEHKWDNELIILGGYNFVLPEIGLETTLTFDLNKMGLSKIDTIGIQANNGGVFLVDDISFEWQEIDHGQVPVLEENFSEKLSTNENYYWANDELVIDGILNLVAEEYGVLRFGTPLVSGSKYLMFDIKLAPNNNATTFRVEIGDDNIITIDTLIMDGFINELTEDVQTVIIDMTKYTNVYNLDVLGFHINKGGVIIDNLVISMDNYGYQMSLIK